MVQPTRSSNSSTCPIASIYPIQPPLSTPASKRVHGNPHYDNAGRPGSNLLLPNVFISGLSDFSQVLASDGQDLLIRV
jgi:hypothetical protein